MTDRELLELAAKAAGVGGGFQFVRGRDTPICYRDANGRVWNPLTDDGDALRLAVKLNMDVASDEFNGDTLVMCNSEVGASFQPVTEPHGADPYAATRRAITRAAAEIGRSMK